MYHDIFVNEFNMHFGYPRTDSCSTCDGLTVQIESATELEKPQLEQTLEVHHKLAQEGYDAFKYNREMCQTLYLDN